ncbi:2-oxoglutarate-dependent dioxygenase htyE-like [Patiria miniata]|uniref:Fe2OG dioxygenase domain-containing protein n=1 Tax=Patiria miniata TaxID=46514 RepID=A0A913Z609_PATMI|nr:2-oxoglutarate-dependent dioxygenase htyE-like [Patiria miniata]XP_038047150.1 2-oxoglutarate-dependent dioxygenase htyE-like [Patiria miniata]XP_038047151.1 2-oxoglutarate-dependent dioxygenase htyE-like [Patiria miniata]XP_038047152.1 2-oxoglutarate-dependent dioxygenase htyE-like [Patiria miniata]
MGDSTDNIPVIDFSAFKLSLDKPDYDSEAFKKLVQSVHHALTTIGFFYIVNADFPPEKLERMWKVSKDFFHLPAEIKNKYPRNPKENHGYVHMEREKLNPDRPHGDLKELFNYHPMTAEDSLWPTETECPNFKSVLSDFWDPCLALHQRVLEVMGHGLQLEDPLLFVKHHVKSYENSGTTLRTLYYPAFKDVTVKEEQARCGEHSDYGGITLLFQERPGLEVRTRKGDFMQAQMVEGGILVNIGDLMQRWTADKYLAVKHRVLLDTTSEESVKPRQSIAFFGHPDYDALIECIDGSNKYAPVNSLDYINMRFGLTY